MRGLTIGRAAREAGVGVETIRFYERQGLVSQPPKPTPSGFRSYPQETVERIRFIRKAQGLGFSLREIRQLLGLRADPGADASEVRARAAARLEDVARKITELERIRAALERLITACPGHGALDCCAIMAVLDRRATVYEYSAGREGEGNHMNTMTFVIDGMHCDGCARTVKALLTAEDGIHAADVSFAAREARVLYDPHIINEDRVRKLIERAGYRVEASERSREG